MKKIQDVFIEKKKTLVLAESCTGGLIASLLTRTAGCSKYFLGSFVTYCNGMKKDILEVEEEVLHKHGAVSEQVCKSMCIGALKKSGANVALSVTGDAGPDGDQVGVVYGAIGTKEKVFVWKIPDLLGLSRVEIQQTVADFLLALLYDFMKNNEALFANE